jgi:hypothetical protein
MTTLLEDPMPIILFGIVGVAVLAFAFVNTRRKELLWAVVGVVIVVLLGIGLEWLVVTEVEEVEATLEGVIDALEANDLARLLDEYVAESATRTRTRAAYALGLIEVDRARANRLDVRINHLTSPPTAEARFTGVVYYRLRDPSTAVPYEYYAAGFRVELRREGDRWLITDHEEQDPRNL